MPEAGLGLLLDPGEHFVVCWVVPITVEQIRADADAGFAFLDGRVDNGVSREKQHPVHVAVDVAVIASKLVQKQMQGRVQAG